MKILTKELRNVGTMKGKLTSDISNIEKLLENLIYAFGF